MYIKKLFVGLCAVMFSLNAIARNDVLALEIDAAMNSNNAQQRLNQGVSFYFSDSSHAKAVKVLSEVKTNKKTNAFNKSDEEACQWVFLSAMLKLQEAALRKGGNAVVGIKSNYQNNLVSSETSFNCGAGTLMAGVALAGKIVQLESK